MTYTLIFRDLDRGETRILNFYGLSKPLIPRIGELVRLSKYGNDFRHVKDIKYELEEHQITATITTGNQ